MLSYVPLKDCIGQLNSIWMQFYAEDARKGNTESMVLLSDLLLKANRPPRVSDAMNWLKKACYSNPEAAFKLARYHFKGRYVRRDLEKAYFYYSLTSLYKCRCDKQKAFYHSQAVSSVHPCFHNEAQLALKAIQLTPRRQKKCDDHFNSWKAANLKN